MQCGSVRATQQVGASGTALVRNLSPFFRASMRHAHSLPAVCMQILKAACVLWKQQSRGGQNPQLRGHQCDGRGADLASAGSSSLHLRAGLRSKSNGVIRCTGQQAGGIASMRAGSSESPSTVRECKGGRFNSDSPARLISLRRASRFSGGCLCARAARLALVHSHSVVISAASRDRPPGGKRGAGDAEGKRSGSKFCDGAAGKEPDLPLVADCWWLTAGG